MVKSWMQREVNVVRVTKNKIRGASGEDCPTEPVIQKCKHGFRELDQRSESKNNAAGLRKRDREERRFPPAQEDAAEVQ